MIIKYEFLSKLTDEVSEVEVSEELGRAMVEMEKDDFNNDRRETRRHCYMSELEENGRYIADDSDLLDDILEEDFTLTEYDDAVVRQLIEKVTVNGRDVITITFKGGFEVRKEIDSGN